MDDRGESDAQVRTALREVERWGRTRDWVGSDPYDGLLARRVPPALLRRTPARRVLAQAVKRSPLDLRPLLGVPPGENAAAIAWVVSATALGGTDDPAPEEARLRHLVRRLEDLRSPAYPEPCWGYHWPFASRVFDRPAGAPNTIATVYAAMALLDAHARLGDERLAQTAADAGRFFLRRVPQTPARGGAYFGYWPGDRTPVHNANLHVCGLLARLYAVTGETEFAGPALEGLGYALAHQRDDGAWWYGELENLRWVDNFHTGYVLDSLRHILDSGLDAPVAPALDRGLTYYRRMLFLGDGTPRYTDEGTYPIDSQCVAQAIQTFALNADRDPGDLERARRTFRWAQGRMRTSEGTYRFQRRRLWTNDVPHVRGTMASMLLALAHLARAERPAAPAPALAAVPA